MKPGSSSTSGTKAVRVNWVLLRECLINALVCDVRWAGGHGANPLLYHYVTTLYYYTLRTIYCIYILYINYTYYYHYYYILTRNIFIYIYISINKTHVHVGRALVPVAPLRIEIVKGKKYMITFPR